MRRTVMAVAIPLLTFAAVGGAQAPVPPTPPATPTSAGPAPAAPAAPAPAAPAPRIARDEALRIGRLVAHHTNVADIDSLVAHADPSTGAPEAVRERLKNALAQIGEQVGTETKVVAERVMLVNGGVQYWRDAEYTGIAVPLVFRVVLAPSGKWRGFTISPAEALPPAEEIKP